MCIGCTRCMALNDLRNTSHITCNHPAAALHPARHACPSCIICTPAAYSCAMHHAFYLCIQYTCINRAAPFIRKMQVMCIYLDICPAGLHCARMQDASCNGGVRITEHRKAVSTRREKPRKYTIFPGILRPPCIMCIMYMFACVRDR